MNEKAIFLFARELGCCEGCSVRCLGVKNPNVYQKLSEYVKTFYADDTPAQEKSESVTTTVVDSLPEDLKTLTSSIKDQSANSETQPENSELKPTTDDHTFKRPANKRPKDSSETPSGPDRGPPEKRLKWPICVCCLGIMQKETWPQCYEQVKDVLSKKRYESPTFACALSAPISTILREKAIALFLKDKFTEFDTTIGCCPQCEECPRNTFLALFKWTKVVQFHEYYPQSGCFLHSELEIVKKLSPEFFKERSYRGKQRFPVEFTKRSVEQALDSITAPEMRTEWQRLSVVSQHVSCVSVVCTHVPIYLGGRYIKLSRELCQTPWILHGTRLMESSVQDIIFDEIAKVFHVIPEDIEHRLKFLSAGREDVDVRCLGNGRPFAVEFSDPRRFPTVEELQSICDAINADKRIMVKQLALVSREDLTILKQGEETKSKTYDALCIKLGNSKNITEAKQNGSHTVEVTETDIQKINSFTNLRPGEGGKLSITQKTPIRVLHRRPLLERTRMILELEAKLVPEHPQLFTIRVKTSAGTYIKEWVHGELGRAKPNLGNAIDAPVDILALDVIEVHLDWPPVKRN